MRCGALTSVAYGPEAIIAVLAVAGARALHLVLPVTVAIVVLLAILVFSYRQVIDAFVDRLRRRCCEPVIVLIPVALPDRLRYRFLHNHIDLVLTRALRYRPDVVVARVPVRVHVHGRAAPRR